MSEKERPYLECPVCGCPAVYADEEGFFYEESGGECLTCHYPGHVEIAEFPEDPDQDHAYWTEHYWKDEEWRAKWPEMAAQYGD